MGSRVGSPGAFQAMGQLHSGNLNSPTSGTNIFAGLQSYFFQMAQA
jgi:hypothetical protein